MKRTELKRNPDKPLKAKSELKRKTPLTSRKPPERVQVDRLLARIDNDYEQAKKARKKVTPEERNARKVVRARSGGACELCAAPATQMHHRKKSGREWTPENLLHVCGAGNYSGCHALIELNPTASKAKGWWLLPNQDPATEPVSIYGGGRVLLHNDGTTTPAKEEAA